MSSFSAVDRSVDPSALIRFLDAAADAELGMKHYAGAAHAGRRERGAILDLGCGAGHDLTVLAGFGLTSVGVDPSAVMLAAARPRASAAGSPLVRAGGEALPFGCDIFAGCRIERVLMHVTDPLAVLAEVVRCLRPGGLVTVCEPDWSAFRVTSDVLPERAGWINPARHPDIGGRLWELLEQAGCDVLDRVEELSVWRSLATLRMVTGFPDAVDVAVAAGRVDGARAERWVAEQGQRETAGMFHALLPKILLVAAKRAA